MMMDHGMGGSCSPEEKEAFKNILQQVRSLMSSKGISESDLDTGDGKDDYLDPETLLASAGKDKNQKSSEIGGSDIVGLDTDSSGDSDEDESPEEEAMESPMDESKEPFDPKEAMDYFKKRVGSDRKPLKGVKIGMTEIAMAPKKRM